MLVYHYQPETGRYLGSSPAHPDPEELRLRKDAVQAPLVAAAQSALGDALDAADQIEDEVARGAAAATARRIFETAMAAARHAADAVRPEHWLIPAHATIDEPPAFGFDEAAVWRDGAWVIEALPEPDPEPEPQEQDLADAARFERNRRIEVVRPLLERHRDEVALGLTPTWTSEDYLLVLQYVQALRDVPEQDGFPVEIDWPSLPSELLETGA